MSSSHGLIWSSHGFMLSSLSSHGLICHQAGLIMTQHQTIAWYIMAWIKPSHDLIYQQAMACYIIKPWLNMLSSHGLICYQAMAWYVIKPGLDMFSSQGLIYYQAMDWYINKLWLDLLSNHGLILSNHGLICFQASISRDEDIAKIERPANFDWILVYLLYPVRNICTLHFLWTKTFY